MISSLRVIIQDILYKQGNRSLKYQRIIPLYLQKYHVPVTPYPLLDNFFFNWTQINEDSSYIVLSDHYNFEPDIDGVNFQRWLDFDGDFFSNIEFPRVIGLDEDPGWAEVWYSEFLLSFADGGK